MSCCSEPLLVVVGVLSAGLASRVRLPGLLVLLGIGMLVADDGLAFVRFDDAELAQSVSIVALVVILFEAGLSASPAQLRGVIAPAGLLATVGVVVTAAVIAVSGMVVLDLPSTTAWLLGAVVASTDAAAVRSVLRDSPVPRRIGSLLEAESGFNDPFAVLLTVGVLETWAGDASIVGWVAFGLRQLAAGAAVGVAVGLGGGWLARRVRLDSAALFAVLGSGLAGLAYGTAAWLGGSGLLAVYISGILLGHNLSRHRNALATVHGGFAAAAEMALFLLLGLLVFPSDLGGVVGDGAIVAVVLMLIARPLSVVAVLPWFRTPLREMAIVAWAGLRGAVPIVLATFPLTAEHPSAQLVFNLVFFVVLLSVAVQGSTISFVASRLGLSGEVRQATTTLVALDTVRADVVELRLEATAAVVGHRLMEVPMPAGIRVSVLVRGDETLIPTGETQLTAGDLLIVVADASIEAAALIDRWAATRPPAPL